MRFCEHEIEKNKSISQLALLTCIVPDNDTNTIDILAREYAKQRSWEFTESDMLLLKKKLSLWRKKCMRQAIKKTLRTSKRFQAFKMDAFRGVTTKEFFESSDLKQNVLHLDQLMCDGQILKDGNTCFVSRINLAGQQIVVKRYNHKGIMHSLRHTIKHSRARHCWLSAHRLAMFEIATPKPLAFVEQMKGPLVWNCYILTEYIEAPKLSEILSDSTLKQDQRQKLADETAQILAKLGIHRITHGDAKHTNILIGEHGPILTDLDSMKLHRCNCTYRLYRKKDQMRFERDQKRLNND